MPKADRKKLKGILEIVKRFLDKLEENNFPVQGAFLFGSYAKGTASEWSDIDVCVVSPKFREHRFERESFLWSQRRNIDARIEPVGLAPEDFKGIDPLAAEIKKTGIRVK